MTNRELKKRTDEISKYSYRCKCGHSVVIYPFERKVKKLCSWHGEYVYINEREEFKDRLNVRRNEKWKMMIEK